MIIRLVGTQPLLMHNNQTVDPLNSWSKQMAALKGKKNKTDSDLYELDRLKFGSSLYWDDETGPFLPAANLFRCLMEAGSLVGRLGKTVERSVFFLADRANLLYDGPRNIDELWGDGTGQFVDRRVVVVQRQRIMGVRACFPEWAAEFTVDLDTQTLNLDMFEHILVKAGSAVGIGDFRRFYGKFEATIT